MFRIHLAKLKLDKPLEYYSERMAALTPGFAGDESSLNNCSPSLCRGFVILKQELDMWSLHMPGASLRCSGDATGHAAALAACGCSAGSCLLALIAC